MAHVRRLRRLWGSPVVSVAQFVLLIVALGWLIARGAAGLSYQWQWYRVMPFIVRRTLRLVRLLAGPAELVPAFLSAVICLALFEAAYVAEIVRAGIESIERGQWEAAASLGMTRAGTMRFVVLPQAIQRVVPPLAGQFISLVKDSSIASLISVQELAFMAAQVSASTARVFEVWITASAMYFGLCFGLAALFGRLEESLAKGLR